MVLAVGIDRSHGMEERARSRGRDETERERRAKRATMRYENMATCDEEKSTYARIVFILSQMHCGGDDGTYWSVGRSADSLVAVNFYRHRSTGNVRLLPKLQHPRPRNEYVPATSRPPLLTLLQPNTLKTHSNPPTPSTQTPLKTPRPNRMRICRI